MNRTSWSDWESREGICPVARSNDPKMLFQNKISFKKQKTYIKKGIQGSIPTQLKKQLQRVKVQQNKINQKRKKDRY